MSTNGGPHEWKSITELATDLGLTRSTLERRLGVHELDDDGRPKGRIEWSHYQVRRTKTSRNRWEARVAPRWQTGPLTREQIAALIRRWLLDIPPE